MSSLVHRKCNFAVSAATIVLLFLSMCSSLYSQTLYGTIVGTITDQSGAVVPNAAITVTERQTGQVRNDSTDSAGRYTVNNLLPGTYEVKVVANGFRTQTQTGIVVSPNIVTRIDLSLQLGQTTEQVTVNADATLLQTDKADTHSEITGKAVQNMPLGGYRNYQTLVNLVPGSTPGFYNNSLTDTPGRALTSNINGGNAQTNITRIDGATSINVWLPTSVGYVTPAEMVDTVNVTTSAGDAEQGMAGGSAVTLVTKSGTNEIHGSAFEFHDDQHLKARNFFATSKPVGIYNNFGASLGGPIVKNKLFYFVNYDATKQKTSANGTYTVPTADQRAGNFSASPTIIYDPATGGTNGTNRTPFPNNMIPTQRIAAAAMALQSYYPAANLSGVTSNYAALGGPILDRYSVDTKINYNRNDRHAIWGHYGRFGATAGGVGVFGVAGGPAPGADPGIGHTTIHLATIGHTYTFSPNVVLDGVVGYERQVQNVTGQDYGTNFGDKLGIPGLNGADIRASGFPDITISGYTQFGVPNWMPLFRNDESYTHSDNLSITKGAHQFRFGFDMVRHHLNHWQPELSNGGPRGLFDFSQGLTGANLPDANGKLTATKTSQFNAYAAFLLGNADDIEKGLQYILMTAREWQFGFYGQDRWQVSRKLTVTIGLRYELYPLMTRAGYGIERYDPTNNNVYMGGRGDVPENVGITVSHKLFAPRAGIAYRLNDKTVIRTGYGLNYDPLALSRPWRGFYPLTINAQTVGPNGYTAAGTLAGGIGPVIGPDLSTGIVPLPGTATERSPWGGEFHRGYIQSWNFTIERKLPLDIVTSVAYVGQHSTHLVADLDLNAGVPGLGTAGQAYNNPLYNNRTAQTNMSDGYLSSSYNSLQVAVNKSFSKGLMLKGAYTYSKAIDYADADGWQAVGWNYLPAFQRNRAVAGFDRTHVFQMGWVYDLPFGKDKMLAKTGIASQILGNWQVSGIMAMYTGQPFTVTADGTSLAAPNNTQTANQVKTDVQRFGNVGPGQTYYDTTAFAPVTAVATFGTSGRNILRNPGVWNTDLQISRIFPIKERLQLQFRSEFYNLPNTSHFNGVASSSVNNANFMLINSSYGERQVRFALRMQW